MDIITLYGRRGREAVTAGGIASRGSIPYVTKISALLGRNVMYQVTIMSFVFTAKALTMDSSERFGKRLKTS